jgi:hypothetical protein
MKTTLILAVLICVLLGSNSAMAQRVSHARSRHGPESVSTTTTTTVTRGTAAASGPVSRGTLSAISRDELRIQSGGQTSRYELNTSTLYLDDAGNPVSSEWVQAGAPITVEYFTSGPRMIATRVYVHREAAALAAPPITGVVVAPAPAVVERRNTQTIRRIVPVPPVERRTTTTTVFQEEQ